MWRMCRGRRGSWARRFEYEHPLKAAEREERDRQRAEVRRYPIDDTELHAELRDKAFSDGSLQFSKLQLKCRLSGLCIAPA